MESAERQRRRWICKNSVEIDERVWLFSKGDRLYVWAMEETVQTDRKRRLELARQAFREFYAQCFWSADPGLVVEEQHIPLIVRNLRLHGGHKGFRIAAELCRWENSSAR